MGAGGWWFVFYGPRQHFLLESWQAVVNREVNGQAMIVVLNLSHYRLALTRLTPTPINRRDEHGRFGFEPLANRER